MTHVVEGSLLWHAKAWQNPSAFIFKSFQGAFCSDTTMWTKSSLDVASFVEHSYFSRVVWCFLSNRSRLKLFFAYLRILNWSIFFLCTFRLHKRLHLSFYCNYSYFRNLLFSILIVFDERWFINIAINKMSLRRECQGGCAIFNSSPKIPIMWTASSEI